MTRQAPGSSWSTRNVHAHAGHAVLQVDDGLFVLPVGLDDHALEIGAGDAPSARLLLEYTEALVAHAGHAVLQVDDGLFVLPVGLDDHALEIGAGDAPSARLLLEYTEALVASLAGALPLLLVEGGGGCLLLGDGAAQPRRWRGAARSRAHRRRA